MKILVSNILKYTIGLPFLLMLTVVTPSAILVSFMLFGDAEGFLEETKKLLLPNK